MNMLQSKTMALSTPPDLVITPISALRDDVTSVFDASKCLSLLAAEIERLENGTTLWTHRHHFAADLRLEYNHLLTHAASLQAEFVPPTPLPVKFPRSALAQQRQRDQGKPRRRMPPQTPPESTDWQLVGARRPHGVKRSRQGPVRVSGIDALPTAPTAPAKEPLLVDGDSDAILPDAPAVATTPTQ